MLYPTGQLSVLNIYWSLNKKVLKLLHDIGGKKNWESESVTDVLRLDQVSQ